MNAIIVPMMVPISAGFVRPSGEGLVVGLSEEAPVVGPSDEGPVVGVEGPEDAGMEVSPVRAGLE